ncbi:hypothetical protein KA005_62170 [bacterium]|nr:hypothetical protein [bacterium]
MMDIEKFNEQRRAEKISEFLLQATLKMAEGKESSAMSLLLAAFEVYGAKYNVVEATLKDWIANGKLSKDFAVPNTTEEFKEMYYNSYQKNFKLNA